MSLSVVIILTMPMSMLIRLKILRGMGILLLFPLMLGW